MKLARCILTSLLLTTLGGCSYFERIGDIGETPKLTAIENPVMQPGYKPVSMPMPAPEPVSFAPNSLWRSGARAFFKDQRAARVGDILTVLVEITDKAEFDNASKRERDNKENLGLASLGGLERTLQKIVGADANLAELVKAKSDSESDGKGSIGREEKVTTKVAAVVTQILPNGNMVIEGRQEVRVNYEKRELIVAGVVRPEDITSENNIPVSKIAEARVSYGGKGTLTDVQQPRYGQQLLDIVLPF